MKTKLFSLAAAVLSLVFIFSATSLISFASPASSPIVLTPETELHSGNDNSNHHIPCNLCSAIYNGTDYVKIDNGDGTNGVFTATRSSDGTSTLLTVSRTVTVSMIVLKAADKHQIYVNAELITLEAGKTYQLNSIIKNT